MPFSPASPSLRVALAMALSFTPAAARAACPGLGTALASAAGASPQMVVSADFNRDGHPDLAFANGSGAALDIALGLPGGSFGAPVAYAGGSAGRALAVSDFNSDGIADVAVGVSNGVAIWLGRGDGTFFGGALTPAGSTIRGIVCADFDGDGIVDLALASAGSNDVQVLRGLGAAGTGIGGFAPPVAYPAGTSPARIVAADVDGDGVLDLLVADNGSATVAVLHGLSANGLGNGAFAMPVFVPVAGSPWGLVVLDADGDGVPDVAVSNGAGTNVTLLRNDGHGHFTPGASVVFPTAPRDLVAGDFDGDGLPDLAAACAAGNAVGLARGTGGGAFAAPLTYAAGAGACGLVAGDWNGDGAADLACANSGAASVTRWLNGCPAPAGAAVTLLAPVGGESWWPGGAQTVRWSQSPFVATVDVDLSRDGGATWLPLGRAIAGDRLVVPASGDAGERRRVRVRDGLVPARANSSARDFSVCGVLRAPLASLTGLAATALVAGDLDGDGNQDLVAFGAGSARVLVGRGDGRFTAATSLAMEAPRRARLLDADGDGRLDLVSLDDAGLAIRAGDGRGGFAPAIFAAIPGASDFTAADFTAEGELEFAVISGDATGGRLEVIGTIADGWGSRWHAAFTGAPGRIAAGDFDGDGITDLGFGAGNAMEVWRGGGALGRGDGTFSPLASRTLTSAPGELAPGDFARVGRLEMLACAPLTGDVCTMAVTAAGSPADGGAAGALEAPRFAYAGAAPEAPVVCDFDGDGWPDLAVTLAASGRLAILPGSAAGFGAPATFAPGGSVRALVCGDFDGDGNPDLVVARGDSLDVACYRAMCPPKLPATLALAPVGGAVAGFARTLHWSRSASVALSRVELSRDDGVHWSVIADALPGDSLVWVASGPASGAARVRVVDAACPSRAALGEPFTIREPVGALTSVPLTVAPLVAAYAADGEGVVHALLAGADGVRELHVAAGVWAADGADDEPGARAVALADLAGHGVLDALSLRDAAVAIRRAGATDGFATLTVIPTAAGNSAFLCTDVDRDGLPDLVVAGSNGVGHRVAVCRSLGADGEGMPRFAEAINVALPAAPVAIACGDVSGDGITDLAVTHAGGLSVLLGRGDGTFRLTRTFPFGAGARELRIVDLDGNGTADLAAADSASGAIVVTAGDGAGGFGATVALALGAPPASLLAADVDGDGHTDLVITLANGGGRFWRGSGSLTVGAFAPAGEFAAAARAASPGRLDIDGDGVPELLLAGGDATLRTLALPTRTARPRLSAPGTASRRTSDDVALEWSGASEAVDVQLSRDDGAHWSTLAAACTGGAWHGRLGGPATARARLRVRDAYAPTLADTASAAFTLEPSTLGAAPPPPPARLSLGNAWPNPAPATVRWALELPAAAEVEAVVCDIAGRRVRVLSQGGSSAGRRELTWNGSDAAGTATAPGLYFLRVRTGGVVLTRRVVRVR